MSNKPRRWTWEELKEINPGFIDDPETCFITKEPYIDHLEKEIERLNKEVKHRDDYKAYYDRIFSKSVVVEEKEYLDMVSEIKELKQRIAELEQWNRNHVQTAGWQQTQIVVQDKTIATLRQSLEFYANDTSYRSKHGGHIENRNLHSKIGQDCGQKARTALKECFEDEDE